MAAALVPERGRCNRVMASFKALVKPRSVAGPQPHSLSGAAGSKGAFVAKPLRFQKHKGRARLWAGRHLAPCIVEPPKTCKLDVASMRAGHGACRHPREGACAVRHSRLAAVAYYTALAVLGYGVLAYIILPFAWTHHEHQKGLAGQPMRTHTADGIPGDPINIGLVGLKDDVTCAMHAAGWRPADARTLWSSVKIADSVILDRPYPDAPVSPLFYQGRREDLAFEKPAGRSADRRHHARFWQVLEAGAEGRPVWLGAATFDQSVGLSHYTGEITHHIAPDIDAERDLLTSDLAKANIVAATYEVSGIGPTLNGRNGGGDRFYTDGEIKISVLSPKCAATAQPLLELPSPPLAQIKNSIWRSLAGRPQSDR